MKIALETTCFALWMDIRSDFVEFAVALDHSWPRLAFAVASRVILVASSVRRQLASLLQLARLLKLGISIADKADLSGLTQATKRLPFPGSSESQETNYTNYTNHQSNLRKRVLTTYLEYIYIYRYTICIYVELPTGTCFLAVQVVPKLQKVCFISARALAQQQLATNLNDSCPRITNNLLLAITNTPHFKSNRIAFY